MACNASLQCVKATLSPASVLVLICALLLGMYASSSHAIRDNIIVDINIGSDLNGCLDIPPIRSSYSLETGSTIGNTSNCNALSNQLHRAPRPLRI